MHAKCEPFEATKMVNISFFRPDNSGSFEHCVSHWWLAGWWLRHVEPILSISPSDWLTFLFVSEVSWKRIGRMNHRMIIDLNYGTSNRDWKIMGP